MVTGSRVVRNGYQAPTPTTVLGAEEIQHAAAVNIADTVFELPALAGSTKGNTSTVSAGLIGVNALSLRNLGSNRTLVLLDGQRLPAATTGTVVDINTIPNSLIKRVDIVTGGASAQWGSDAVAGVVNFVLDKDYTGFKGEASGGVTTYGDDANFKVSLTAGLKFADGRGHLLLSAEDAWEAGVGSVADRPWYQGYRVMPNPAYTATNGQPYYVVRNHVGYTDAAPGFIVSAGPLAGLVFGPGGTTSQLNYGQVGGHFMTGGDWQTTDFGNGPQALSNPDSRQNVFARTSFEVTPHINIYGQFMWGRSNVDMINTPVFEFGNLSIKIDNPFLPASVVSAMQKAGVTSLTGGTWNQALGGNHYISEREQFRYTLGANGDFRVLGSDWTWNAFWNKNVSFFHQSNHTLITANYNKALDAVMGPNGAPICRSTLTDPTNGCAPLNLLGTGVASPAAINYVQGSPTLDARIIQDEFSGTINGEPFRTWAGPISVAFGVEHRREAENGTSDPLSLVNSYWDGNYKPIVGSYTVTEGFFETVVPLLKDSKFGKSLDIDAAVRETSYSSSGRVTTWKVGGTYAPVEDFRLRVTRSRDIRAGNLSDLYQPGQTLTGTFSNPWHNNASETLFYTSIGNSTIAPEKADTFDIGGVIQPRWIPGLSLSVDYWDIKIRDAISSISLSTLINGCYTGQFPDFCQYITRDSANNIVNVNLKPVNLAAARARGIDFEASYHLPVAGGELFLRGLATRYLESSSNSGLPGAVTTDVVGNNGTLPFWRFLVSATYERGPFTGVLTARGLSAGTAFGPTYIQCASNCPAYTAANPTIDNNRVDGALYFDLSLNYKILNDKVETFVVVNNIANVDPAPFPNGTGIGSEQWGVSQQFYDVLGRTFRAGIRFKY